MTLKPYQLTGALQMFEATGKEEYREFVLNALDSLENTTEILPPQDVNAYFFALKETGNEKYRQKIEAYIGQNDWTLEFMPTVTAYETAYRKKEHYNEIAARFKEKGSLTGKDLVSLIETIGQMSEEIYEYYRELRDLFKSAVKEKIKDLPDSSESPEIGYSILRACNLGVLQTEKYFQYGELVWKTITRNNTEPCFGLNEMIKAQVTILRKQEV